MVADLVLADLYDYISFAFSWRWPKTDGTITAVDVRTEPVGRGGVRQRLVLRYSFSVGDDGPYTGESAWPVLLGEPYIANVNEKLKPGQMSLCVTGQMILA